MKLFITILAVILVLFANILLTIGMFDDGDYYTKGMTIISLDLIVMGIFMCWYLYDMGVLVLIVGIVIGKIIRV